jgi:hypothetical protein
MRVDAEYGDNAKIAIAKRCISHKANYYLIGAP